MASIQDWKNGKYRAHWRDDNNRPQSKVFARKRDAELWLDAVASDLHRGEYISPTLAATKFSVWADRWWATTGKHTSHTRRGYWKLLDGHVLPYFGDMPMNRIDYAEVERFISDKLGDGHSAKRVRDMVSIVSLIMKLAMKSKARRDNPAKEHTIPHRKRKIRQGDVPDMADVHRLVAATRDPYKPAVWLLALLGLRPAELCGLRVGAVDFGRR